MESDRDVRIRWREQEGWTKVLSCDYNGWNDTPEDEREWFDQHPEIWNATPPEGSIRPRRETRLLRRRHGGGLAA
jgi:hypothetical protein